MPSEPQIVLVTGASSGIGRACAEHLARQGFKVYGTSRHPGTTSTRFSLLQMDVTDEDSVTAAVQQIMEGEGHLDVVINNAGYGIAGAVADTSTVEMQEQFETNYFGTFRVCRTVLPILTSQRSGVIINISSVSGLIAVPFQAAYSASKFAVEGFTEALRMELKGTGIRVALIEPGDFQTGFTANRVRTSANQPDSPWYAASERAVQIMEHDEQNGSKPQRIARLVERIIRQRNPRLRWSSGPFPERLAIPLKRILPGKLFEWIILKNYKVLP